MSLKLEVDALTSLLGQMAHYGNKKNKVEVKIQHCI